MPLLETSEGKIRIPWDWESPWVSLAVLFLSVGTLLLIPLRIIGQGYEPIDDAMRHTAKAVTDKPWDDILVMAPDRFIDAQIGWHRLLGWIHDLTGFGPDALLALSLVSLFWLIIFVPLFFAKRIDAWMLTVLTLVFASYGFISRLMLGRPLLVHCAIVLAILLSHEYFRRERTPWGGIALLTLGVAFSVWVRTTWHLYLVPFAAVVCARDLRAIRRIGSALLMGIALGLLATGAPWSYFIHSWTSTVDCLSRAQGTAMLVSELQPGVGFRAILIVLAACWIFDVARGRWDWRRLDTPAFYLLAASYVLSLKTTRFWDDFAIWGALVLLLRTYEDWLDDSPLTPESLPRVPAVLLVCAAVFFGMTGDRSQRWTGALKRVPLERTNPEIAPWLPDPGGIIYSADMGVFYRTFHANPDAPWRYILGFEASLMPEDDQRIYHRIQWNRFATKAYQPWVEKMRPEDRLIISGRGPSSAPNIENLEWHYVGTNTWSGRLPSTLAHALENAASQAEKRPPERAP